MNSYENFVANNERDAISPFVCQQCVWFAKNDYEKMYHNNYGHVIDEARKRGQEYLADLDAGIPLVYYDKLSEFLRRELEEYRMEIPTTEIVGRLRATLRAIGYPNVFLFVTGSAAFGATFKCSNVNILFRTDLYNSSLELLFKNLCERVNGTWKDENNKFQLKYNDAGITVHVKWCPEAVRSSDVQCSVLFEKYVARFPNLLELMRVVRLWALRTDILTSNSSNCSSLPGEAFDVLVIHYYQQRIYLPFHNASADEWETHRQQIFNEWNLGFRWLDFLRYMTGNGKYLVYQITQMEPMDKFSMYYPIRNKANFQILHPFRPQNLAQNFSSPELHAFFSNLITTTYLHFLIPRISDFPLVNIKLREDIRDANSLPSKDNEYINWNLSRNPVSNDVFATKTRIQAQFMIVRSDVSEQALRKAFRECQNNFKFISFMRMRSENYHSECPSNVPLEFLPSRSRNELNMLSSMFREYFMVHASTESQSASKIAIVRRIEEFLREAIDNEIMVIPYGSQFSGFATQDSDLDLTVMFEQGSSKNQQDPRNALHYIYGNLAFHFEGVRNEHFIASARVPVMKCTYGTLNVDITFNNPLAVENTNLLKEYCRWTPDDRFRVLALIVKKWTKKMKIGDATSGTLSSYAHINLLIAYLQQCEPPVLPRLQEDFWTEERRVKNWRVSFYKAEDREIIDWQRNRQSLAELFLGYLKYYSNFDFGSTVIQCRQKASITKLGLMWPTPIAIQDPFDLSHNLTQFVRMPKVRIIVNTFRHSWNVFSKENIDSMLILLYKCQLPSRARQF